MKNTLPSFPAIILVLLLFASLATPVSGHAVLLRSDPSQNISVDQSPSRVTLWFSETVATESSTLRVLDSSEGRVDNRDLAFSPDGLSMSVGIPVLAKGVFTVSWQVVSAVDGHPTGGAFSFGVQTIVPPPPSTTKYEPSIIDLIPEAAIRGVLFLGQTILVGGLLFHRLVLSPWTRELNPTQAGNGKEVGARLTMRLLRISLLGAGLALAGSAGLFIVQSSNLSAGSVSPVQFLGTRLAIIGVARVGLATASLLMLAYMVRTTAARTVFLWATTVLGGGLLLPASFSGHNAAVGFYPALAIASDWLHLVGVAAWVGGLFSFVGIIPVLRGDTFHEDISRLVPYFSRLAMIAVGVITITGVYSAWLQVGSFSALLNTLYGTTLIVKVSLVASVVLLGTLNQLLWHPRMLMALRTLTQAGPKVARMGGRIIRSVRVEMALAIVVLLTVGLLTALPPAAQVAQNASQSIFQSKTLSQQADDVHVTLSIFPFRVGANSFEAQLKNGQGRATENVTGVIFGFRFLDFPLGTATANGEPAGEGQFLLQGTYLSLPGNWSITVTVRRSTAIDSIARFETSLEAYPGLDTARVEELPFSDSGLAVADTEIDGSGDVWFTVPSSGSIGRFQPRLGTLEFFQLPYSGASPYSITFDSSGKAWSTDTLRHSITSFDPSSKQFSEFPLPASGGQPIGVAFDNSGTAWITERLFSQVRGFTPMNTSFTQPIPTPTSDSLPGPITVDPQQRVWFAEEAAGRIGMLNVTSQTISEYVPPSPASFITEVTVAPNRDIWFAEHGSNRISRFRPSDASFKQVELPNPRGFPWGLKADPQGNIWFAEHIGNKIGFYQTATGNFREFDIPTPDSGSTNLALDQFGNVWFGENQGKLGVLALEPHGTGLSFPTQDSFYTVFSIVIGLGTAIATASVFVYHRKRMQRYAEAKLE